MKELEHALIVGLSQSGKAMVEAILTRGWQVQAHDDFATPDQVLATIDSIQTSIAARAGQGHVSHKAVLPKDNITVSTGQFASVEAAKERLQSITCLCVSPGIPPANVLLVAATELGIPIWSEPELALQLNSGRTATIVVTGTNGKTTTTQLIAHCLDIPAVGNVGTPMVTVLASDDPPEVVVCELSSFQLFYTHSIHPNLVVLTNIAQDHVDWHGSYEAYQQAKAQSWQHLGGNEHDRVFVLETETQAVEVVNRYLPSATVECVDVTSAPPLQLQGPHNKANAALAKAVCLAFGMPEPLVDQRLSAFAPQDHRMQLVATHNGVAYVNDSKATNPHAAKAAISGYKSVIWIAGGLNKGLSFGTLAECIAPNGPIIHTLTIGSSAQEIQTMVEAQHGTVTACKTLDVAVATAFKLAKPGDTVLLSPATASMDQFKNYAERGTTFATAVANAIANDVANNDANDVTNDDANDVTNDVANEDSNDVTNEGAHGD